MDEVGVGLRYILLFEILSLILPVQTTKQPRVEPL